MKGYPHLFAKLFCSPLLLHAPVRQAFEAQLLARMGAAAGAGVVLADSPPKPAADGRQASQQRRVGNIYEKIGNVALIRFHGVVDKTISEFDMDCYGGLDLDDVDNALARAAKDSSIDTVVLDFNTPGGSVTGTPETAARFSQLGASLKEGGAGKETHSFIATMCCSAGYYVASQADRIVAAPSSCVGSIGVYTAILDESRALEAEGVNVQFISAGKFKGMGASFKPLTDEEKAMLQEEVDEIWEEFKAACLYQGRKIDDADMQGQSFSGTVARQKRLVDELTTLNLDEYISSLQFR